MPETSVVPLQLDDTWAYGPGIQHGGWVPTVSLTVHVRARPAPGWLRLVQRARLIADGWLDEECEVWDSAGRLVAQGHQLAGYRP